MIEGICAAGLSTWIAVVLLEQIHVQLPDLQVCRCLFATEPVQVGHLREVATRNTNTGHLCLVIGMKRLVLRAGHRVLRCGVRAEHELLNTFRWIVDRGEM